MCSAQVDMEKFRILQLIPVNAAWLTWHFLAKSKGDYNNCGYVDAFVKLFKPDNTEQEAINVKDATEEELIA